MRMYSADIFITANVAILAQNEQEAFEMVKKMKDTPLTVPEDELFTDRFFDDPLVPDFSFATTFTFWKMLGDSQLTDHGAAENYIDLTAFARKDPKRHVFSGTALLGSTVYIKASRRSKAEAIFQRVNRAKFAFKSHDIGVACLGMAELDGVCFGKNFTGYVHPELELECRGECAKYGGPVDARKWTQFRTERNLYRDQVS